MTAIGGEEANWPPRRTGTSRRRAIPARLAPFLRQDLDELTHEITTEVQRRIAEYSPGPDGVNRTSTQLVIGQAVHYFVDHLADPSASRIELDETLLRLGRNMAYEGRRLDALRSAFHIGATLAWRHIRAVADRQGVATTVLGDLGDDLFDYIESLADHAAIGFHEAQAQLSDAAHQWRARILELILAGHTAASGELAGLASAGGWNIPESVALLAVRPDSRIGLPNARLLHPQALASLHADAPVVLLPAPVTSAMHDEIAVLFDGHRVAIGCDVPLRDSASSLRWARRALELADAGVLPRSPVLDCQDHIGVLWIHAEPLLANIVNGSVLAPLWAEPPHSRRILGQTLLHWINTQHPSAPAMAEALGVHPQTIRYRLKRLRQIFGDRMDDPDTRLQMFLALSTSAQQWSDGEPTAS